MTELAWPKLAEFYTYLKVGIPVGEFLRLYDVIRGSVPSEFRNDFRVGRGQFQRFEFEVRPMSYFSRKELQATDVVQFPLDSGADDCVIRRDRQTLYTIQITASRARENQMIMRRLNERGSSPGFLGLSDRASTIDFERQLHEPDMYSTEQLIESFGSGIGLALEKKSGVSGGDTLVIDAPRYLISEEQLEGVLPRLSQLASASPFRRVFLVRKFHSGIERCYQLSKRI